MPHLTCKITTNKRTETIFMETSTDPRELLLCLENFRQTVNETITQIIKDKGAIGNFIDFDPYSSSSEEELKDLSCKRRKI